MIEFFTGKDLWANIIGGVVVTVLIALFVYCKDRRKHKILRELTDIMGQIIEYRNIGEKRSYSDKKEWIRTAKALEDKAFNKASELSTKAGSFIKWLDRIPPLQGNDEVAFYVSILSTIVVRIRGLLERHS